MNNFLKKRAGFTLIEVLIAMVISILIIGTGTLILISGRNISEREQAMMNIQVRARETMNRISRELHNTCVLHAYVLNAGGSRVSVGSRLRFQVPVDHDGDGDVLDNWGHIEWGEASTAQINWAVEYVLNGTDLIRRIYDGLGSAAAVQAGLDEIIANDVSSLTFTGQSFTGSASNLDLIEIDLTIQRTALGTQALSTPLTVSIRNKVMFRN